MIELLLKFSQTTGIYSLMNSVWGWPIAESLHFLGLSLLIGTIGVFDLRMMGFCRDISLASLNRLIPFGVFGYFINVITGTMFISTAPDQYIYNPAVQTKLFFMLIAGLNMLVFYCTVSPQAKTTAALENAPTRARVIAAISLACWCIIIICGRLITYYRPPYHWCFWC